MNPENSVHLETPTQEITPEDLARRAEACTPLQRRILGELARDVYAKNHELAKRTNCQPGTVTQYMRREPFKSIANATRTLGHTLARTLASQTMTASTGRVASAVSSYAEGLTDSDTAAVAQARLKASEMVLKVGQVLAPDAGGTVTVIGTINAALVAGRRPPEPWAVEPPGATVEEAPRPD